MITKELQKFSTILPEECQAAWKQLFTDTIDNQQPLMVCLAGRQGLGKTSLINMLLGERLLPIGESSLNVPVHFIYGQHFQIHFVDSDGTNHSAEHTIPPAILAQPPAHCKYVKVSDPQDWLRGIELVDLPAQTDLHHRYLNLADAVVYLIPSVGPNDEDMALIQSTVAASRQAWVGVGRWDEVEVEAGQGKRSFPDLQPWEEQIQTATGQDISVIPVSQKGTGKFALITFLQNLAQACNDIREKRLHTASVSLLFSFFENLQQKKQYLSDSLRNNAERLARSERLLKEKNSKIEEFSQKVEKVSQKTNTILVERSAKIHDLEEQSITSLKLLKEKDHKIEELSKKNKALLQGNNATIAECNAKMKDSDRQNITLDSKIITFRRLLLTSVFLNIVLILALLS